MDASLKQESRFAQLTTPLGKDVLVLVRFGGDEALSELFEYRIEAQSKDEVDYDALLGRPSSVTVKEHGLERHFHGIVTEARWGGKHYDFHVHHLVMRPALWQFTRSTNCRIFQDKKAPDIIKEVLEGLDMRWSTQGNFPEREYCVQYRETDFAFVSRLLEHEGIYYFFEHSADKHTVVFTDAMSSHKPVPGLASVEFVPSMDAMKARQQHLYHWISERQFRTGKVELNDYNELTPSADQKAKKEGTASHAGAKSTEMYDYPGKYKSKNEGEQYARVVLEAEQARDGRRYAAGNAANLFPGGITKVTAKSHLNREFLKASDNNKEYLVVRASHKYVAEHYRTAGGSQDDYSGNYELLPKEGKVFRAPILTPKPLIHGIQTAVVTGPKGEEIYTDKYGRIKVQFHWDRYGKKDERSSCWIRVAEVWAGKKWGGQHIPRIGMEAVVQFLEGDPDRPLVTGTVFNDEYKHPWNLPDNKTQSGIKSNSSKGGNGFNQFRLEDNKGSEEINMHAQKDHNVKVRHAETWEIGEAFLAPTGQPSRQVAIKKGDDKLKLDTGSRDVDIALMDTLKAGVMIKMECGASKITITPASIMIESPLITLSGALIKIN